MPEIESLYCLWLSFVLLSFPIIWWANRSELTACLVNFIIFHYLSILAKYVKCPLFYTYLLGGRLWCGVWMLYLLKCAHMYTNACVLRSEMKLNVFLNTLHHISWDMISLELEHSLSARLVSLQTPGFCLSPFLLCWGCRWCGCIQLSACVLEIWTQVPMFEWWTHNQWIHLPSSYFLFVCL